LGQSLNLERKREEEDREEEGRREGKAKERSV